MSFDFTLVGFQGMTPAQAEAKWLSEFNELMNNSDMPIIVWPWHDYGPTQWMVDPPTNSPYTLAMYTNFIRAAFNAGSEFVTLDDLAQRISTFNHTNLSYTVSGNTITATVAPQVNNLGTFALDFEDIGTQKIKSVAGWYAYDQDSVFLDADGGTFQIELGTSADDVSHITSIGQRAKLLSLTGDGTNLAFVIGGEGKVVVDLKLVSGWILSVTGATYTLNGEILTLNLGTQGLHAVSVQQAAPVNTAPTDITVTNLVALAENTAVRTLVANLAVVDPDALPALRNNVVTVSDARFEYDAGDGGLYLRAGQAVDFETQPVINLTLTATDAVNSALTYSEALAITVLNGNDGLGILLPRIVSMERASTDTPLNLAVPADPDGDVQTFIVSVLPSAGALRLAGAAVTQGQTLTLAQFQALTYSFPDVAAQDIAMTIVVNDGNGHLDPLSVVLRVTAGVNSVLNGTAGADRLDGAFGDDTLNGLGGNDTLIGGIGNDTLDGGTGADLMLGGAGNDRYYVDNAGDEVVETAGNGSDTVYASVNYALGAGQEIETLSARTQSSTAALNLTGNEFANSLLGSAGINILDGGIGADKLYGLAGNDIYYVDNAADQVFETIGNGTDTVYASVSYALLAGQHIEVLSARDTAGVGALNLTGNELANTLIGNAGANTLDGKAGADVMSGGAGNDLYVVDNAGDVIIEGTGQGTLDRVISSISYSLAAGVEVESLATANAAGTTAINLTGNEFAQTITGNAGANILDGRGGADTMAGGAGNDLYYVDNAGDVIIEGASQGTLDRVLASVSYTLAAGVQVESLATANAGGTEAINLTGNAFAQSITGNAGSNILNGGAGSDTLTGGLGNDIFVFNTALGASNIDTITDFAVGQDRIWLDDAIFTALPSLLTADQFVINATGLAQDGSDRIIYQTTTGYLFYDSNGSAAGGATRFATLSINLGLTFDDFLVV
jgi:Ca2+-binding RTX toxin-like protein